MVVMWGLPSYSLLWVVMLPTQRMAVCRIPLSSNELQEFMPLTYRRGWGMTIDEGNALKSRTATVRSALTPTSNTNKELDNVPPPPS